MKARVGFTAFLAAGLVTAFALAFFVSPQASGEPDGLSKVAIDEGLDAEELPHALDDLPTAGYAVEGVDNERLSTGLAGLIGVAATFVLAGGLFLLVRRSSKATAAGSGIATSQAT